MANRDVAMIAMIAISATAFLISDGERRRVCWIRAMRRCLLRMSGIIRYEQPGLYALLQRMDLRATPQEKMLTRLLHACAKRMENGGNPELQLIFAEESAHLPGYGVLGEEDRTAFEHVLGELGKTRLPEQLRLLESADERLRAREETLANECARRARLIRTLGLAGGAAVFLILI